MPNITSITNPIESGGIATILGSGFFGSSEFPFDSSREIVVGAYHVDPVNGSDSNDGKLVSEGGTGPWQDVSANLTNLVAGDTLYLREGTHVVTSINMKYSHASGSDGNLIEVTSYPGEEPLIDCSAGTWVRLQNRNYWAFTHLKLTNYSTGWDVGEDILAANCKWYSIYAETNIGGDNIGLIRMRDATAYDVDKVVIKFTGDPLTTHQNTGGIYHNDSNNSMSGTYKRVEVYNFPNGIYFKHGDDTLTSHTGNVVVRDSFFHGCTRNTVGYNAAGVKFENCIFHTNFNLSESDGGEAGCWNWFDHCTFYANLNLRDQLTGATNNKLTNCIVNTLDINGLSSVTSDSDYNLYVNNIEDGATSRDLASWQTANSSDANSLQGVPTYEGDDFELVASYALVDGSIGKAASSSGSDIGADVSIVGVPAVGSATTVTQEGVTLTINSLTDTSIEVQVLDVEGLELEYGLHTFEVSNSEGSITIAAIVQMAENVVNIIDHAVSISDMKRRLRAFHLRNESDEYVYTPLELTKLVNAVMKYD